MGHDACRAERVGRDLGEEVMPRRLARRWRDAGGCGGERTPKSLLCFIALYLLAMGACQQALTLALLAASAWSSAAAPAGEPGARSGASQGHG